MTDMCSDSVPSSSGSRSSSSGSRSSSSGSKSSSSGSTRGSLSTRTTRVRADFEVPGAGTDAQASPEHDDGRTPPLSKWTRIGTLDDIPRLGSRVVRSRDEDIAVFRTSGDRVFAMHDRCPHKQGKLSQGIVHGTSVTCPLHNWVIGLDDGVAKDPDEGCVRTVPVKLEGRDILLEIVA
jgi:nitrite reductase (NADH) small subunit